MEIIDLKPYKKHLFEKVLSVYKNLKSIRKTAVEIDINRDAVHQITKAHKTGDYDLNDVIGNKLIQKYIEAHPDLILVKEEEHTEDLDLKEQWDNVQKHTALGFSIIPIKFKDKKAIPKWKEYQKRKPSEDELETWFKDKRRNIGVLCGEISNNLFVIDFDSEEAFRKFYPESSLITQQTRVVKTGRGYHVYYYAKTPIKTQPLTDMVSVKGEGSYVVSEGSFHQNGVQYQSVGVETPYLLTDVSPLLQKLFDMFLRPTEEEKEEEFKETLPFSLEKKKPYCIALIEEKGVKKGERNERAFDYARFLYNKNHWTPEKIKRRLKQWDKKNNPPLGDTEIGVIAYSVVSGQYKFGCGRLKSTNWCHKDVCSYFKLGESDLDELIELARKNEIIEIGGTIHFDPTFGIFYILPIHPPLYMKSLNILPVLSNSAMNSIPIASVNKHEENPQSDEDSLIIPQSRYVLKDAKLIYDKRLYADLLDVYSQNKEDPNTLRTFDLGIGEYIISIIEGYIFYDFSITYYAVACWIIGTYMYCMFSYYPFLILRGEKGSGKGTNLMILSKSCWNATKKLVTPSSATIFRIIEQMAGTLIIEEYHRIIKDPVIGASIKAIIEAGVERDAVVPRCSELDLDIIRYFKVFCPKVLSTRTSSEQEDKALTIVMTKTDDPKYAKIRSDLDQDNRLNELRPELVKLVLLKSKEIYEIYKEQKPTDKLTGRYFNLWSPILSICKVVYPDKYDEMVEYAEKEVEKRILGVWRKENIVLEALYTHLDKLEEKDTSYMVYQRDILNWTVFTHYRPISDSLTHLKLIQKEKTSKKGKIYYLYKERLKTLFKERKMLEIEPLNGDNDNEIPIEDGEEEGIGLRDDQIIDMTIKYLNGHGGETGINLFVKKYNVNRLQLIRLYEDQSALVVSKNKKTVLLRERYEKLKKGGDLSDGK